MECVFVVMETINRQTIYVVEGETLAECEENCLLGNSIKEFVVKEEGVINREILGHSEMLPLPDEEQGNV